MNRLLTALYPLALAAGFAGIGGAALAASRHHPVALAMTLLIAAFFLLAVLELRAFRRASQGLAAALAGTPGEGWVATWTPPCSARCARSPPPTAAHWPTRPRRPPPRRPPVSSRRPWWASCSSSPSR